MAPARVRGCVVQQGPARWQILVSCKPMPVAGKTVHVRPANYRQVVRRLITVRLRSKSCPAVDADHRRLRELGERRETAAPAAGECEVEDQVGRVGALPGRRNIEGL